MFRTAAPGPVLSTAHPQTLRGFSLTPACQIRVLKKTLVKTTRGAPVRRRAPARRQRVAQRRRRRGGRRPRARGGSRTVRAAYMAARCRRQSPAPGCACSSTNTPSYHLNSTAIAKQNEPQTLAQNFNPNPITCSPAALKTATSSSSCLTLSHAHGIPQSYISQDSNVWPGAP